MDRELLENALKKAGIVEEKTNPNAKKVLKSDLFEDGISEEPTARQRGLGF